jgi:ABC-type amino acid transport substrate-binding protein
MIKVPLADPLAAGDEGWARFVNTWIALKRRDGTIDRLYRRWILGQDATATRPRWSVVRDVLHWVE